MFSLTMFGPCSRFPTIDLNNIAAENGLAVVATLQWRCVDCVIHHERDVREEKHYERGTNKQ